MGACGSAPVHHDDSHPAPVGRQRSASFHGDPADADKADEEEKSSTPNDDAEDNDDPASHSDSGNGDSDSENSQSFSHDPSQSQYGEVPVKRKKKRKGHRRNKSRTAHKKAQKALEERMRALKTDDLFESEAADVVHSPVGSARAAAPANLPLAVTVTADNNPPLSVTTQPKLSVPAVAAAPATDAVRLLRPSPSSSSTLPIPTSSSHSSSIFSSFDPEEVTILVIDNDEEVCQCVESWLSDRRYSVITCLEGREAVEVLLEAGAKDDSSAEQQPPQSRLPPSASSSSSSSSFSANEPSSSSSSSSHSSASVSSNAASSFVRILPQPSPAAATATAASADLCDIDMIVCDWHTSYQSQKFLDWVMDNASLAHIPVIILADDEMTAQGMDRLMRRGAADILRKPLVHHPFIHSIQTIIKNKAEAAHVQLLRSKGDEYKQELNRAQKNSLYASASSSLSTPKRSFMSMMNTFVTASPKGSVAGLASPIVASAAIQQVHAILVSGEESIHSEVSAAVLRLPLTLHSCASPHESLLLQEDIDAQSNTSTIISHTATQAELMSPHFPSHFGFAASNLSSPASRTTAAFTHFGNAPRSTRVSIVEELSTPTSHLPTTKKLSTATTTPHVAHQPLLHTPLSPRMSQSTNMRNSIIRNLHSLSSYFGTELFILDSAAFRGEEGAEWIRVMQARSQKQQTPVLLLTPESDPSATQLIRSLHPLQVVVVSVPLSSTLLVKKVSVLLESISIIRHQRLYAYRAQAYRMLVKKIREKKANAASGLSIGSSRGVLMLSEGGTALNSRASVSMSLMEHARNAVPDDDALRSLMASPTGMLPRFSITSPSVAKPSSRAVNGSFVGNGLMAPVLDISNQRKSEVMLQPFTQFPPPGLHNRKGSESVSSMNGEHSNTYSGNPLRTQSSATDDGDQLSPHATEGSQLETPEGAEAAAMRLKRASSSLSPRLSLSPQQSMISEGSSPNSVKLERTLNTLVGLARLDQPSS